MVKLKRRNKTKIQQQQILNSNTLFLFCLRYFTVLYLSISKGFTIICSHFLLLLVHSSCCFFSFIRGLVTKWRNPKWKKKKVREETNRMQLSEKKAELCVALVPKLYPHSVLFPFCFVSFEPYATCQRFVMIKMNSQSKISFPFLCVLLLLLLFSFCFFLCLSAQNPCNISYEIVKTYKNK